MKKIAVTGTAGAGKSTVLGMLSELGAYTIDADKIVGAMLSDPDSRVTGLLAKVFGGQILDAGGRVNKERLSELAFSSRENVEKLNAAVHPEAMKKIAELMNGANEDTDIVAVEVPLLFESGKEKLFDYVVCVGASDETAASRNIPYDLKLRNAYQWDIRRKKEMSDFYIQNDVTREELRGIVSDLYDKIQSANY